MILNNVYCQQEFERLSRENQDLPDYSHPLINVSDVLRAYFALADYFTDPGADVQESMLVGLRSIDLLCSALGRQTVTFGRHTKYTEKIDICSTLFFGLVKNHAFTDGNKRTALLVLLYQLWLYGYYPKESIRSFEKLVVAVAANNLPKTFPNYWNKSKHDEDAEVKTISRFLRKSTEKKDHTYHITITMHTFADALSKHGVSYSLDAGKIHFERVIISQKFGHKTTTKKYTAVFGGWTRCVGAASARKILENLGLYDQFPSYQSFVDGNEALYSYIQKFEEPLRRLKDE